MRMIMILFIIVWNELIYLQTIIRLKWVNGEFKEIRSLMLFDSTETKLKLP